MSEGSSRLEEYLDALRRDGRSSPMNWHEFYLFLRSKKKSGQGDPPVPLILSASGESDAAKYRRLSNQLEWARANECLDEALRYLEKIPVKEWNSCPSSRWDKDSYPEL